MPPRGFTVITVSKDLYKDAMKFLERHRDELKKVGIKSLTAWLTATLYKEMEQYENSIRQSPNKKEEYLNVLVGAVPARLINLAREIDNKNRKIEEILGLGDFLPNRRNKTKSK